MKFKYDYQNLKKNNIKFCFKMHMNLDLALKKVIYIQQDQISEIKGCISMNSLYLEKLKHWLLKGFQLINNIFK